MKGKGILKILYNTLYEVFFFFHISSFAYYYSEFDKTDNILKGIFFHIAQ